MTQAIRITALGAIAAMVLSERATAQPAAPSEQEIAASAAYDQGDYAR